MTRRKVLVTGASGLIGGLALKQLGDRYEFSGLSRRPVAGIPHLSADITDAAAIQPAFSGIHTVLHLAAANGADQWLEWAPTMAITVQGTLNVYEAAHEAGVQRVVFFSSGCCQLAWEWDSNYPYGTLANGPDDEIPATWPMVDLDWPVRPDSPYAVGKLFGENLGAIIPTSMAFRRSPSGWAPSSRKIARSFAGTIPATSRSPTACSSSTSA